MNQNKTSDSFYNRIDIVEGVNENYKQAKIGIIIDKKLAKTVYGQVMIVVATNMIARWANNIKLSIPSNIQCLIPIYKNQTLAAVLKNLAILVKPECNLHFTDSMDSDELVLSIGATNLSHQQNVTWIDATGWLGGYGFGTYHHEKNTSKNSFLSACFAACLGVSEIFRQAIGEKPTDFVKWFSLIDYASDQDKRKLANPPIDVRAINLGTIHQVGCGAIGSSFDFFLALSNNIHTSLHLIDYDKIEDHNLCSSLIFSANQKNNSIKKVNACHEIFKNSIVNAFPFEGDYSEFISSGNHKIQPADIILCFANEKDIWPTIQNNYPPLTFHATTNKSWGTNFGRHIPVKDWCIMCRFQNEIKQTFTAVCSEGNVSRNPEKEILGTLPFLAPTSSLITLAELIKLNLYSDYSTGPNFVEFSMRRNSGKFMAAQRPPKGCEICNNQEVDIYPSYITKSKYWLLSNLPEKGALNEPTFFVNCNSNQ